MQQDVPSGASENPESHAQDQAQPETPVKIQQTEPDNTLELAATAIGGIITIIGGVFDTSGHNILALWTFFIALCCGIFAFGSFLYERTLLPSFLQSAPRKWIAIVFVAFALFFKFLHSDISKQSDDNSKKDTNQARWSKTTEGQLADLKASVRDTQQALADQQRQRHLTPEQSKAIKEAIAPYAGQTVSVCYPVGDAEASRYAREFERVFQDAGWVCGKFKGYYFAADFENVITAISKDRDPTINPKPKALYPLTKVLMELGLSDNRGLDPLEKANLVGGITVDEISLRVGVKTIPSHEAAIHDPPPPAGSQESGRD